jgi:PAS domain S-box-containing protein
VLLVQDFPPVELEPMTTLLRQWGYDVLTAFDGEIGLGMADERPPDLVVCDIALPDMSGAEFVRNLRANDTLSATPVLMVSGLRQDSEPVLAALRAGADDYMKMPYDPMLLLSKTTRLVERRRAEKAFRQQESYFRLMVENTADRITLLREDMTTVYENPAVERQTGYSPDELVGKNNFSLVHPEDLHRFMEAEAGALVEYRHKHKDGSWRLLESIGRRFVDESGIVHAVISTREKSSSH